MNDRSAAGKRRKIPEPARAEIEAIFRREAARLISVLTRIFGPANLELAEDVVQEAFVAALDVWSQQRIPANPAAWLLSTARNHAVDAIRRERTRKKFAPDLAIFLDSEWTLASTVTEAFVGDAIRDDQLRMIFMCCHPSLTPENRLTLVLRTLCGLSVPAIARALLTTETTVDKRLYRTRRRLAGVEFRLPTPSELPEARDTAHAAMYLLFNEGVLSTREQHERAAADQLLDFRQRRVGGDPIAVSAQHRSAWRQRRAGIAQVPAGLQHREPFAPLLHHDALLLGAPVQPARVAVAVQQEILLHSVLGPQPFFNEQPARLQDRRAGWTASGQVGDAGRCY